MVWIASAAGLHPDDEYRRRLSGIIDGLLSDFGDRPWLLPGLLSALGLLALSTIAALAARRKIAVQAAELANRVEEKTASLTEEVSRRGRLEAELSASDWRYREIVETAREGIATFDSGGRCIVANREFARIMGKPMELVRGRHLSEFLDPGAVATVKQQLKDRSTGAPLCHELTIKPEGCQPRDASLFCRPWIDEDGGFRNSLVTVVDMTARKTAEESIRQSEAYYRLLFDSNPSPMFVLDRETYSFLSVNQAACDTYGYSLEEFRTLTILDLQLSENLEACKALVSATLSSPTHWAWRYCIKNGALLDVDITAQDLDFHGRRARLEMIIDTTGRHRAAAALRESEASLARAQRIAHIGSFQWLLGPDSPSYTWSDEVYRILGLPLHQPHLTLATFFDRVHPDDRQQLTAAQTRALDTGMPVECELRVVRPDGAVRQLRSTAVVETDNPAGRALVGTLQDLTEYRVLEEQLQHSQRLESIGRLAGGVAHDFNNLLTVINGYSGRILSRLDPNDILHEEAAQIVHAGKEAATLTRQLLAFGRKQVFRPEVVDLNEAISRSQQILSRLVGESIDLVTSLHPSPIAVSVDPAQLQQVLMNLSVNGRDAMPNGGTLSIRTSVLTLRGGVVAFQEALRSGPAAVLEVTDAGVGMSADLQKRIFEPFFTTKDRSGGTGLGLATVYGIVQQSGGTIDVVSEPGHGASFRVFLPLLSTAVASRQ
jgi:two-component system, cell cycle sensor histidine kinase and response regulator CckA